MSDLESDKDPKKTAIHPASGDGPTSAHGEGRETVGGQDAAAQAGGGGANVATRIAGLSTMKGLVLIGATLTFAGFYAYFMEQIASAANGKTPTLSATMVSAAAALAGILGSAFALVIGTPTTVTNEGLERVLQSQATATTAAEPKNTLGKKPKRGVWLWKVLSIEPGGKHRASYPLTFGIWVYAVVAGAVAIIYFLNPSETPDSIKALATAFAGYVVALMTAAYGIATKASPDGSA